MVEMLQMKKIENSDGENPSPYMHILTERRV